MLSNNTNSKATAALLKCDKDWFNEVKELYNKGYIGYVNRWSVDPRNKPVNLKDHDEVYLYIDEASDNQVKVLAKGTFKEKVYTTSDKLFALDSKREGTVKDTFTLYNLSNGSQKYSDYKDLLQKCTDNNTNAKKIVINDDSIIGSTIIIDLTFYSTPEVYNFKGNPPNACGFRYITDIKNSPIKEMTFKES